MTSDPWAPMGVFPKWKYGQRYKKLWQQKKMLMWESKQVREKSITYNCYVDTHMKNALQKVAYAYGGKRIWN